MESLDNDKEKLKGSDENVLVWLYYTGLYFVFV